MFAFQQGSMAKIPELESSAFTYVKYFTPLPKYFFLSKLESRIRQEDVWFQQNGATTLAVSICMDFISLGGQQPLLI